MKGYLIFFNFNHAWYYKITNDGHFTLMDTKPEWMQYCTENDGYKYYEYYRHPKYFSNGFVWQNNPMDARINNLITAGKNRYDFSTYLRLFNKTSDGVECFGFTFDMRNELQMTKLLNGMHYLRLFTRKFREDNRYLFSKLEDNQIDIAKLIGSSFYARPNLVLPGVTKGLLLQENSDNGLSDGETAVIKLLVQGYPASQIGKELFRSKRTIEHRIEKIKEKLGCYSKIELIQKIREFEQIGLLQ